MRNALAALVAVALILGIVGVIFGVLGQSNAQQATSQVQSLRRAQAVMQSRLARAEAAARSGTATNAHLGLCWNVDYGREEGDYGTYAQSVTIDAPIVSSGGVYSCPQGDTYTSIVPQPTSQSGG